MNQEENKQIIAVRLYVDGGVDYLEFDIESKKHKLDVNSEDNQEAIKKMFCALLPLVETKEIEMQLSIDEGYDNTLLREVSTSYVKDLNTELDNVRASLIEQTAEADDTW